MDYSYTQADTTVVAEKLLGMLEASNEATVVGLSGDLGAGKTTLVQALAQTLGVREQITSPTFVIAKYYDTQNPTFQKLIHIDAYRIDDPQELMTIGWDAMNQQLNTLVVIEWPEKVEVLLPKHTQQFRIEHAGDTRHIKTI